MIEYAYVLIVASLAAILVILGIRELSAEKLPVKTIGIAAGVLTAAHIILLVGLQLKTR